MKRLFAVLAICCPLPTGLFGAVIRVPGDQPTIQAGIDAAEDGYGVNVAAGRFDYPDGRSFAH